MFGDFVTPASQIPGIISGCGNSPLLVLTKLRTTSTRQQENFQK
jgi:hypothetical protein